VLKTEASARVMAIVMAMVLLHLVSACSAPDVRPQHPLLNTIVHVESKSPVARDLLMPEMSDAAVIYLCEKHDNPVHHQQQLWILRELIRLGHRPVVGFEIFSAAASGSLMEFVSTAKSASSADRAEARLRTTMGIENAQDERWLRYAPLLRLAREHKLTVFGIDLPMALRRRVSRVGIDGLSAVERSSVPEIGTADADYRKQMLTRLKAAHCGHGSDAYLGRLFQNWQARNETMARAITTAASERGDSPVLVILGGGHVRGGEGVVARVAERMPDVRQLVVSFIEVDEERVDPAAYTSGTHAPVTNSRSHKELMWFTAAHGLSMDAACKMFRHGKS